MGYGEKALLRLLGSPSLSDPETRLRSLSSAKRKAESRHWDDEDVISFRTQHQQWKRPSMNEWIEFGRKPRLWRERESEIKERKNLHETSVNKLRNFIFSSQLKTGVFLLLFVVFRSAFIEIEILWFYFISAIWLKNDIVEVTLFAVSTTWGHFSQLGLVSIDDPPFCGLRACWTRSGTNFLPNTPSSIPRKELKKRK